MGYNETREFVDDDCRGFTLVVYRANDGDFHLSIVPDYKYGTFERNVNSPEERGLYKGLYLASIRVRSASIGGGDHAALYAALAGMKDAPTETEPDACLLCGEKPRRSRRTRE